MINKGANMSNYKVWFETAIDHFDKAKKSYKNNDYCDAYEFELKKMENTFDLPLLRIRNDYSSQKTGQLKTRIAAFGEILCP